MRTGSNPVTVVGATPPAVPFSGAVPHSATRIPELDGLRGLAIASVVFSHYIPDLLHAAPNSFLAYLLVPSHLSWSGVDLFFVLSGFLIGGLLLDAKTSQNYFPVFYRRRFFRIVPAYMVSLGIVLLLAVLAAGPFRNYESLFGWRPIQPPKYSYFLFLQNFWMSVSTSPKAVDVTWSLAVEEQFYLTLPLLVWLLSARNLLRVVVGAIVLAPLLRCLSLWIWPERVWSNYVLMPCRADALMLGVLSVIVLRNSEWRTRLAANRTGLRIAIVVLAVGMVFFTRRASAIYDPVMQRFGFTWLAFFYASILVYSLTNTSGTLSRFLRLRGIAWLGAIAYGVYLFHVTVLRIAFALFRNREPGITGAADFFTMTGALLFTLIFCRLSWLYFEKPLIAFAHKVDYDSAVPKSRSTVSTAADGGL